MEHVNKTKLIVKGAEYQVTPRAVEKENRIQIKKHNRATWPLRIYLFYPISVESRKWDICLFPPNISLANNDDLSNYLPGIESHFLSSWKQKWSVIRLPLSSSSQQTAQTQKVPQQLSQVLSQRTCRYKTNHKRLWLAYLGILISMAMVTTVPAYTITLCTTVLEMACSLYVCGLHMARYLKQQNRNLNKRVVSYFRLECSAQASSCLSFIFLVNFTWCYGITFCWKLFG